MKSRPRRIISVDKTGFLPHDRAATPRLACSFPIWKSTNMIDFWRRNGGGASTRITVCADVGVCANDCIPRRLHTPAKISSNPQENNLLRKNYGAGCSPHFQTPYENRSLVDFKVLPPTEIPTICAMAFEILGPIWCNKLILRFPSREWARKAWCCRCALIPSLKIDQWPTVKNKYADQLQHIHLARSFPLPKIDQSSFFIEEMKSGWNIRQKNIQGPP